MALRGVGADADEVCSISPDGFVGVTEALRLSVSAQGEVLQVEVEHDGSTTPPIGEAKLLAIVAERLEVGGFGAWLQH